MKCLPTYKGKRYNSIELIKNVIKNELQKEAETGVKREDQINLESDLTFSQKAYVATNIAQIVMKKIGMSDSLTSTELERLLEETFDEIMLQNQDTSPDSVNDLISIRDQILGLRRSFNEDSSARSYIATYLGLEEKAINEDIQEENVGKEDTSLEGSDNPDDNPSESEKASDLESTSSYGYDQSAYEIDMTKSLSKKVMMLLSGVKSTDDTGQTSMFEEFMGLDSFIDPSTVLLALQDVLANSSNDMNSLKAKIEAKVAESPLFGFLNEVLERIEAQPITVQNQILNKLNSITNDMSFVMVRVNLRTGKIQSSVLDANSRSPEIKLASEFRTNFKQSSLINLEEKEHFSLNVKEAKSMLAVLEDMSNQAETDKDSVNPREVSKVFAKLGLNIHPYTIKNYIKRPESETQTGYKDLFATNTGDKGPFGIIMDNLRNAIVATEEMNRDGEKLLIPLNYNDSTTVEMDSGETLTLGHLTFFNNNNYIKALIKEELKNRLPEDASMYLDGKSVFGYTIPNLAKSLKNEIKQALLVYKQTGEMTGKLGELMAQSVNKDNFMIQAMLENSKAATEFDVETISPDSFKAQDGSGEYRKNDGNGKISDLGPKDYLTVMQGFFGQMGTGIELSDTSKRSRIASMFFPALSDASDLYILKAAVRDITAEDAEVDVETNQVFLEQNILDHMSTNLVYNELNRIAGYMMNLYVNDDFEALNSDQNFSSMFFLGLPDFNFETASDGTLMIDAVHAKIKTFADRVKTKDSTESKMSEEEQMEALTAELKEFMSDATNVYMTELAQNEKEKLLKKDLETGGYTGEWVDKELVGVHNTGLSNKVIDSKYLDSKAEGREIEEKLEMAALDFAINSLVSQANIQNVFAGDLTNYAKDAGSFEKDGKGNVDFFSLKTSQDEEMQNRETRMRAVVQEMTNKMSDNRSKRLKALLSPSLKNANSKGKEYLQLMMQDMESISDYISSIIELHYPGEITQEQREVIAKTLRAQEEYNLEDSKIKPNASRLKELKEEIKFGKKYINSAFPKVKDFTEITGTDAQEYTTWREHLRTLMDRGMVEGGFTKKEIEDIYKKLNDYEKSDYKGTLELTEKEKEIIFQPLKPLHAGTYSDSGPDGKPYKYGFVNSEFVYVKTSSFPLIPGITAGTELDNIRKNLENLEKLHGMPVRAAYSSGIKVGGTKIAVSSNELSGNILDDAQLRTMSQKSSKVLKREYFGIQQDKKYKADDNLENNKRNEVSRAVQIERALLSNGIATSEEKIFDLKELDRDYLASLGIEVSPDDKISGKDLFTVINALYSEEQNLNRESLYNKFNATGQEWQNDVQTIEKLRNILYREAKTSQARKALDLVYLVEEQDEDGDITQREVTKEELDKEKLTAVSARFKVPIWLNNTSLSIESSLNAMVTKALARLKMPGWSSPVGSSNKFKLKEQSDLSEAEISDIVYLGSYEGGELRYDVTEDGKLKYAQVLVSSRFEYSKEVGQQEDGTPIYKKVYADLASSEYSEIKNGKRVLKEENFDLDLLKALSFRTPYSDLGSGATIEIVGFLPRKMGDLMIVPKEHTVQFGEDYDIDVRNVYSFNTESYKKEDGTIAFRKLKPKKDGVFLQKNNKKIQEEYENERENIYGQATALKSKYYMLNMERIAEIKLLRERKAVLKPLVKSGDITEQDLIDELDLINSTLADLDSDVAKTQYKEDVKEVDEMIAQALAEIGQASYEKRQEALRNLTKMRAYQQHRKKLIENDIIKVYHAVYDSADKEIRKSINKSLNTDLSKDTVDILKAETAANNIVRNNRFRTLYSSLEQQKIMESGHSGKLGIGVHSLWVTFTALAQHLENPVNINFGDLNSEITIGNLTFKPTIGSKNTISNRKEGIYKNVLRLITEVNMENQNVATDNQKLLIMGDRNENEYTINAFALLCNMGVDTDILEHPDYAIKDPKGNITGYKQVHIPSLFLSQPILKRYVELKKQNSSLTNERFMSDKDIYDKLFAELAESSSKEAIEMYRSGVIKKEVNGVNTETPIALDFSNLTGGNLLAQASDKDAVNPIEQAQILHLFRELEIKSKEVSAHQGILKTGSNGIEKSSFKNIHVKEFLKNLALGKEGSLEGITNMYGEFTSLQVGANETIEEAKKRAKGLIPNGFVIGENFTDDEGHIIQVFIPNNFAGAKLASVFTATTDLIGNIFPFENPSIQRIIRNIFEGTDMYKRAIANKNTFGALDMFSGKGLDFTYKIMAGLKNYLGTAEFSDFYAGTIEEERKRILYKERTVVNGEETTLLSLPGYLNQLRMDPEYDWMFKQAFFRSLDPVLNDLNTPDILRLHLNNKNKTEMQNINTFLNSMYEMHDRKLPPFKGDENYTPHKLVSDLARYASLAGDSGGAMGFKSLIPFEVFEKTRYNEVLRMFDNIMTTGETSRFDSAISLATQGNMSALMNLVGPNVFSQALKDSPAGAKIDLSSQTDAALKKIENIIQKLNKVNGKEIFSVRNKTLVIVGFSDVNSIRNVLKDQILRHNPDMLVSAKEDAVLSNASESLEYVEGKEDMGIYGVTRMTLEPTALAKLKLASDTEYFKVNYESGFAIFRKVPGTDDFVQVDKLGMTGSQEFTLTSKHTYSEIEANNSWRKPVEEDEYRDGFIESQEEEEQDFGQAQRIEENSIEDKLENSINLKDTILEVLADDAPSSVIIREMHDSGLFPEGLGPIEFLDTMTNPGGKKAGGVYIKPGGTLRLGGVTHTGPKIILNRAIFNDPDVSDSQKARILAEELIHKATVGFTREYVSTSIGDVQEFDSALNENVTVRGKIIVEHHLTTPNSIIDMVNVMQAALDSSIKEVMKDRKISKQEALDLILPLIEAYKNPKIAAMLGDLSPQDQLLQSKLYRFINLEEFIAGITTDKNFRTEMSKHSYQGVNILDKIAELLIEMFNTVSKFTGSDVTITEAGVSALNDIIKDIEKDMKYKNSIAKLTAQEEAENQKIIDEGDSTGNDRTLYDFNIFAEEDRRFLTERFITELNKEPFTRAMAKALNKVNKKC